MIKLLNKGYAIVGWLVIVPFRPFLTGRVITKNSKYDVATWPNAVSLLRIPLGILIRWFVTSWYGTLGIVALSFYTDALDGKLAEEFFGKTRSGAVVDPACDKIFFVLYAFWHRLEFNGYALGGLAAVETVLFIIQMSALAIVRYKGRRFTDQALRSNILGKMKGFLEAAEFLLPFAHIQSWVTTIVLCAAIVFAIASAVKQKMDNPQPYEKK